jgi:hypothetical protein
MSCTNSITAKQLLVKEQNEKLIFKFDFSARVTTGVTITSADATSYTLAEESSDLVLSNIQIVNKDVLLFIEGGTHGYQYAVECTCELSNGETIVGRGMLKVVTS